MSEMDEVRVFEGDDLDDALRAASSALGVPPDKIGYNVIEEGRRGVFGLGARRVRIRVSADEDGEAVPAVGGEPGAPEETSVPPPGLVETLSRMMNFMGFQATVRAERQDDGWTLEISGPDSKLLAKRDGEILRAVEFLLNRMARRAWPGAGSLRLGTEGFRSKRDEDLVELAREVAGMVARSGRPELLHEMNPYERRLVHITVKEFDGLRSVSEGQGFYKRVRVERARR